MSRKPIPGDQWLQGKVAVVTGGSRGLGFLLSRELAQAGCRVAICARDEAGLAWARSQLPVLPVQCDVSKRDEVEGFLARVRDELGPVDVLVNNAGLMEVGPVQHMQLEDFEQALGVMFWGTVYPTLVVYPGMVERGGGRIVNITSIGGKVAVPHLLPYGCSKFAAVGFSEGLRAELDGTGVSVTTVVPGLMRTGSYVNAFVRSRQKEEFTWFGAGASLPFVSMDAERAARQIVQAMLRGRPEVILSLPAKLLALLHGVMPGAAIMALGLVNQLVLPRPGGAGSQRARGGEVQERASSRMFELVTRAGRASAHRFQPPHRRDP